MTLNRYIVTADITIPAGTSSAQSAGPGTSVTGTTSATPGAGTTVATGAAATAAGTSLLSWTVTLATAAAAGDANNFGLYAGSALLATSVNAGVIGTYPQAAVTTYLGAAATVAVKNIAAGSTGAVYTAALTVTPLQSGDSNEAGAWDGAGSPAGWTPGGFPVTFLQGTPLILDPNGDLYAVIGATNLRAWIDGTDDTGHGRWACLAN